MSSSLLPIVQLHDLEHILATNDFKYLQYLGGVFVVVHDEEIDEVQSFIKRAFGRFSICLDVSSLSSFDNVISLLDSGADKVFLNSSQLDESTTVDNLNPDRLVLRVSGMSKDEVINAISGTSVAIFAHEAKDVEYVEGFLKDYGTDRPEVYVSFADENAVDIFEITRLKAIPVISASALSIDRSQASGKIDVAKLLLSNATTDRPDGLFTTLVTDERGVALGVVYSSYESLAESLKTGRGVYQSRKRGLWRKGESSGDVQELISIGLDCDGDCFRFKVRQKGRGFCHTGAATCFGPYKGMSRLEKLLLNRKASVPPGSYTARLYSDPQLLKAKIMEEASELCEAKTKEEIAFEAGDLLYFALARCIAEGVSLEDVERDFDIKDVKVKRRKGDAKGQWAAKMGIKVDQPAQGTPSSDGSVDKETVQEAASVPKSRDDPIGTINGRIQMKRYIIAEESTESIQNALQRPSQKSTDKIMNIVNPIIQDVKSRGDVALLEYTKKFEKAGSLTSPVIRAPFPESLMKLDPETVKAIDTSYDNIRRFHSAQKEEKPLRVETMPGVVCSRFARPIERVGLYVPGGTAVLPSTALMLGVPAMVAGCQKVVIASPPRADGTVTPEIVYVAHKVGAESIVLAGGAQAIAAMAYGTESVSKVDKILGPGNQFVTAAKMIVSNDTTAGVSIDMPAGPSEVLVIADVTADPAFVASDLLSQAEHGTDSQVICIAVALSESQLTAIDDELHRQANALPRVDIVRGAIDHSVTFVVKDIHEAMQLSNLYAPEHLILQVKNAEDVVSLVQNAGSVFIGPWTPESVGDYSAGVNHSLPTYGYAKQYSGVNLGSYVKHITSSHLTKEGLYNVASAVMQLAKVEELEAHRRAVSIRLEAA